MLPFSIKPTTLLITDWPYYQPGSMAEIPKNLQAEIKALEAALTVPKEKLKEITDHFVNELHKGMFLQAKSAVSVRLRLTLAGRSEC